MAEFDGSLYQSKFDRLESGGANVHGEVDFVMSFAPAGVLDAGCGTGRVAIELARRGIEVAGVDANRSMLDQARSRAPALSWIEADLAGLDLGQVFDVVVLAGNVPLFCPPATRPQLVASCAAHVAHDGYLIAGFQLDGSYPLDDWDAGCEASGLELAERWATWHRDPYRDGGGYAVSVHRRPA